MFQKFGLTNNEYAQLYKKFGNLANYASWQLKRCNAQNNLADTDIEDIIQEILIALVYAGVYYKRQCFIEECLRVADTYVEDKFTRKILDQLNDLWNNRTKHGANKRKFGDHQERILDRIINNWTPAPFRPNPNGNLQIDKKFTKYCKPILWNKQRSLGRKITRERSIRSGSVSLSSFSYLDGEM